MKFKRIIASVLFISLITAMPVFAEYAPPASKWYAGVTTQGNKKSNAVATTPDKYKFAVDSQEFIILDTSKKGEKTYFFIMSEGLYGTHKFSTATEQPYIWFNAEDTNNIAYWLNNDFFNNGNGGKTLPSTLKAYITEWEWVTEPLKATVVTVPDEYTKTSNLPKQTCKIALLAAWEWENYIDKFGYPGQNWYFRSGRTGDTSGVNRILIGTSAVGYNNSEQASVPLGIRPVFFIDSDFFANCKISAGGEDRIKNRE